MIIEDAVKKVIKDRPYLIVKEVMENDKCFVIFTEPRNYDESKHGSYIGGAIKIDKETGGSDLYNPMRDGKVKKIEGGDYLAHYGKKGMKWRKKKQKTGESWFEYVSNLDLSWSDPFGTKARRKKKLNTNAKEAYKRMKSFRKKMKDIAKPYYERQAMKYLNKLGVR